MRSYLISSCPASKDNLTIQNISNSFQQIWGEKLLNKFRNYASTMSLNISCLPSFLKSFLLSFIGYRNFSSGYPNVFFCILGQFISGKISLDLTVLLLLKNCASQNQIDAFISFLRLIFPVNNREQYLEDDEFIFSIIFNYQIPPDIINDNVGQIIQNCINYSQKEFGIDLSNNVIDFISGGSPLPEDINIIDLFAKNKDQETPTNELIETNNCQLALFDSCENDFERDLIQALIEKDTNKFRSILQNHIDDEINDHCESLQSLMIQCEQDSTINDPSFFILASSKLKMATGLECQRPNCQKPTSLLR